MVVVLGHRAHYHRPALHPGAGVAYIMRGAYLEVVAMPRLADEVSLGLGGVAEPGAPGRGQRVAATGVHVVAVQAGLGILPGPGNLEVGRRYVGGVDSGGSSPRPAGQRSAENTKPLKRPENSAASARSALSRSKMTGKR